MAELVWGAPGAKKYDQGLDRGVLFPIPAGGFPYDTGVPWNGLVSMTENVSGGDVESYYYDGVKYLDVVLYEDFQATLECFSTPPEFEECNGNVPLGMGLFVTQQIRKTFAMSWRTKQSDDLAEDSSYKVHLLWGCTVAPSEKVSSTRGQDTTLPTKSYTIYTVPPTRGIYSGQTYKPTAHMIVDSSAPHMTTFEQGIYGWSGGDSFMPTQQQVMNVLNTGFWT